jgi:hypothetical protein
MSYELQANSFNLTYPCKPCPLPAHTLAVVAVSAVEKSEDRWPEL